MAGRRRLRAARAATAGLALVAAAAAAAGPRIGGCEVFPPDSVWNTRVDTLPVHAQSDAWIAEIGATRPLHPDFGTVWNGAPNGIPYVVAPPGTARVRLSFTYDDESDPGPYPIPAGAPIEGGPNATGDRHVLVVDAGDCRLYELYAAYPNADGSWRAGSGAIFDLAGHALRPRGWTSADAAGLPILPGLVRYEETAAGEIAHALRFTAPRTRGEWTWPARHEASSLSGAQFPPMGQRFRLRSGVDATRFPASVRPIVTALKVYGMMLADNGSSWYVSGAPDPRWSDDDLHALTALRGTDFEAVDVSSLLVDPDSARAVAPGTGGGSRDAIEYRRADVDHYFVTADAAEIAALDAGAFAGWARTGERFAVEAPGTRAGERRSPVCRYYGSAQAGIDSHFYSASPDECRAVLERHAGAWTLESPEVFVVALPDPADGACPVGTAPLWRVFNGRRDVNHRYTTSAAVRASMLAAGWTAEGYGPDAVAMCVPPPR
ncbi:MAG: hypothetical protein IT520_20855 [Burkholderiales bacterium]|nr:hypothetical protein [Burkholderiales bacterium]